MQTDSGRFQTRRALVTGAAGTALAAQARSPLVRLPGKVRVALLGLDGHTGEILGPLPALPDVELVAVSDPDGNRLGRFQKRDGFASIRTYTDYLRMLDEEDLHMVGVCNPNGSRAAAILACLERKLHVAAEKPLALTAEDLGRIKRAVETSGMRLTTLLPMRFSPPYLAMKQIVDSDRIGEVAQIAAQKSYRAGKRPAWMRNRSCFGGTIPWIGIHMIDLMLFTSGRKFTEAYSLASHIAYPQLGDMENVTATVFGLDNGGAATLRMDYLRPETAATHGDDRLRLAGTRGVVEYQRSTGVTLMTSDSPMETVTDLPASGSLFADFLDSVYNGAPSALTLEEVYRANEVTLAAHQAAVEHRIVNL